MEGCVDLGDQLHTEMVYLHTDGHPSKYLLDSARPRYSIRHYTDVLNYNSLRANAEGFVWLTGAGYVCPMHRAAPVVPMIICRVKYIRVCNV